MTDCHASLGPIILKELTIMSSAWGHNLYDLAALNEAQVEDIEDVAPFILNMNKCLLMMSMVYIGIRSLLP